MLLLQVIPGRSGIWNCHPSSYSLSERCTVLLVHQSIPGLRYSVPGHTLHHHSNLEAIHTGQLFPEFLYRYRPFSCILFRLSVWLSDQYQNADPNKSISIAMINGVVTMLSTINRMRIKIQRLDGVSQYASPVWPLMATGYTLLPYLYEARYIGARRYLYLML